MAIKIIIPLGGKVEKTLVSVDGAMNITDDVGSTWIWLLCPSRSFEDYRHSKLRWLVTNIKTPDLALQNKMEPFYTVLTGFL